MEIVLKKIKELEERFLESKKLSAIDSKQAEEKELRLELAKPDVWGNRVLAVKIGQKIEELSKETKEWLKLEEGIREQEELGALALREKSEDLTLEIQEKYEELLKGFNHLEFQSLFSGKYDRSDAFLSIRSGAGGVDAQDWTQILERMYLRFFERQDWKFKILSQSYGTEAGLKNVTIHVLGRGAYGYLKSENGVHRLLRNSPFNADGKRQTSFASVELIPEIPDNNIVIKDKDLRIDVYHSSGPGGQGVNTTNSAVRIVHLPTKITVTCQNERSQHQNKETALKILKTKLYKLSLEDKERKEQELKGDVKKATWGKQIRSYFLYGKQLIKDHRSDYKSSDVSAVLDGNLDSLIESYLRWLKK
jgi:peptide chain release factor 2